MGTAAAQAAQLETATVRRNPTAPRLAQIYLDIAPRLGVRGDLAYAQALHETDYFRYTGIVKPEQNNYAGIGATGPGNPGASFTTPEEGVLAHLQHLYAYASTAPLPAGMVKADPHFDLVQRGSATRIGDLNGKWAIPRADYGQMVDWILSELLVEVAEGEPYQITQAHLSTNSRNRPGPCSDSYCWEGVRGIVVHRTASPTQNAWAIREYFNTSPDGRYASSQFVLDNDVILQLMPVGEVAYHTVGKNHTHLGIETCEHNWGTATWPETYRKLVWLTAYLTRAYGLTISDVTGHFYWDPVNRPYDPTYMGWSPGEGQAKGIFEWNQFIADVQAQLISPPEPPPPPGPERIPVRVVTGSGAEDCTTGLLIEARTYVPIRAYTDCILPEAQIEWVDAERRVVVHMPDDH